MKRIVMLNSEMFPGEFKKLELTPPKGFSKESYAETKLMEAINAYNPKMSVSGIDYVKVEDFFDAYKKGKSNGVIIRICEIRDDEKTYFESRGYSINEYGGTLTAMHIEAYLFVTNVIAGTRNAFVSQTVFPTLLEYASDYIDKPNYSIANHPFIFVNALERAQTAKMILRNMSSLYLMEMHYVEAFSNSLDTKTIPKELKAYLKEYASDYDSAYDPVNNKYESDYLNISFDDKRIIWKTDKMVSELKVNARGVDFDGSREKFYWMETLPISVYAHKNAYKIDYSAYEKFIDDYDGKFSSNSDKFRRCKTLLYYLKKFFV